MSKQGTINKITTSAIQKMKQSGEKISMLTAYDYSTAAIMDAEGMDIILIGDSLGMVVLGYDSTLPVTMEDMIHHTKAVSRAVVGHGYRRHALSLLPYVRPGRGVQRGPPHERGGRPQRQNGGGAGGGRCGREDHVFGDSAHGASRPNSQSVHQLGGYKVQGKDDKTARKLMEDARVLEEAGAFSLVLECVPAQPAARSAGL